MAKSLSQIDSELKEFIGLLIKSYNVFAVVLFGSYAEGRAHGFSDTDIEPLPFRKKDYFEHESADFVNEILSKGKVIYKDGQMLI